MVVQVGVIGHRPNRLGANMTNYLTDQSQQVLRLILDTTAAARDPHVHAEKPPLIRIISSLAEGSDRLVAHAGISLGADLQSLLPFAATEYERDFETAPSREEFHSLLGKASAVLELDGRRNDEPAAYESAGRALLYQSDILIVIWDGGPAAGRGGTTQLINEAVALKIPIIWLHANQQIEPCLLLADNLGSCSEQSIARLPSLLEARFSIAPNQQETIGNFRHLYYAERQPRFDFGRFFRIFRDFVAAGRFNRGSWRIANFEPSARAVWQSTMAQIPEFPAITQRYLLDRLSPHYAWADGLAIYYAGKFRSCSVALSLLSACAVLTALVSPISEFHHIEYIHNIKIDSIAAFTELLVIAIILCLTFYGRHHKWHERWLNYRQLAEFLRQYSFLGPLACPLPTPPQPAHFGSDPHRPWVDAMFRMIVRDLGLAPGKINSAYLASFGAWVNYILAEQIDYHSSNARIMKHLNHHLHRIGSALFILTLLTCIVHLWLGESAWLLLGATVLPAFGAAFYAISNQGEYARSIDRSLAMTRELTTIQTQDLPKALASTNQDMTELRQVALNVATIMITETIDWNFVFRFRSLNLPG
jgi:hypothetical protein